jgi:hypothetical protein
MNTQTPAEYVAHHEITRHLRGLGVTNTQLDGMKFRPNNTGRPFAQRTFTWGAGTPLDAVPHILAYCALKWLILENPEPSRDRDDASHIVSVAMAAPIYRAGINHKEAQRLRAKKPRRKLTEEGQDIHSIIARLALSPEHRDEFAKELWFPFFDKLAEARLRPKEIDHLDPKKRAYNYTPSNGGETSMTYGRFANLVSKFRKKSR